MNKVIITGRITKDIELKRTNSGLSVCTFTVAVQRRFKNQNGEREADFVNCTAWRQSAEILANHFHKGSRIGISGALQSRVYEDKHGDKRTVLEVLVDEIEFIDTKAEAQKQMNPEEEIRPIPPMPIEVTPEDVQNLPFDIMGMEG